MGSTAGTEGAGSTEGVISGLTAGGAGLQASMDRDSQQAGETGRSLFMLCNADLATFYGTEQPLHAMSRRTRPFGQALHRIGRKRRTKQIPCQSAANDPMAGHNEDSRTISSSNFDQPPYSPHWA